MMIPKSILLVYNVCTGHYFFTEFSGHHNWANLIVIDDLLQSNAVFQRKNDQIP